MISLYVVSKVECNIFDLNINFSLWTKDNWLSNVAIMLNTFFSSKIYIVSIEISKCSSLDSIVLQSGE